jgi:hypothetical protein
VRANLAILTFFVGINAIGSAIPSGSVIQISHKLSMTSTETSPEKDYFIDVGAKDGVKAGDTFDIFRKLTVINVPTGNVTDLLKVPFGEMKVYLVGDSASVAHISRPPEFKDLPVIEYTGVMLGDEVRLKSNLPFKQATP